MSKRKKYLILLIGLLIYAMFVLYLLHVICVLKEGAGIQGCFGGGLKDFLIQPFAVAPAMKFLPIIFLLTLLIGTLAYSSDLERQERQHYKNEEAVGSAKWMTPKEIAEFNTKYAEPFGKPGHSGKNNFPISKNVWLSFDSKKNKFNSNAIVVGGSGSGKSWGFIIPSLLVGNTSYVVNDPSGDQFKNYSSYFESIGYKVKVFNLSDMSKSSHYNPFHYIKSDRDIVDLVEAIIVNTTPPDKKGGEKFWEDSEKLILVSIMSYLYHYETEENQTFEMVMKMIRKANVDENSEDRKSTLEKIFEKKQKEDPDGYAFKEFNNFKIAAGRTLKSILISVLTRLQTFDLVDIINLTNSDDLNLESIGDEKTILFIITPTSDRTFAHLAAMMYTQLFSMIYRYTENTARYSQLIRYGSGDLLTSIRANNDEEAEQAKKNGEAFLKRIQEASITENVGAKVFEIRTKDNELVTVRGTLEKAREALDDLRHGYIEPNTVGINGGNQLPIHVRFLMDELTTSSGRINGLADRMATVRKTNSSLVLVVQALSQLQGAYKDDWESLCANADTSVYLGGGNDLTTAEWFSKLMGKQTRTVYGSSISDKKHTSSYSRMAVELFSPDRLRTMDERECIVLVKGQYPIKDKKLVGSDMPVWPEVEKCEKSVFVAKKAKEQSEESRRLAKILTPVSTSDAISKHGENEKAVADKMDLVNEAYNERQEKRARELQRNKDANGQAIMQAPEAITEESTEVVEKIGFTSSEDIKQNKDKMFKIPEIPVSRSQMIFDGAVVAVTEE